MLECQGVGLPGLGVADDRLELPGQSLFALALELERVQRLLAAPCDGDALPVHPSKISSGSTAATIGFGMSTT